MVLGLPQARIRRSIQAIESEMCEPDGVVTENATCSGPCAALMEAMRFAISTKASSHEMRRQPGSAAPLGAVRRKGWVRRSG